jgi:hypothetical protein
MALQTKPKERTIRMLESLSDDRLRLLNNLLLPWVGVTMTFVGILITSAANVTRWEQARRDSVSKEKARQELSDRDKRIEITERDLNAAREQVRVLQSTSRPIEISKSEEQILRAAFELSPKGKIVIVPDPTDRNAMESAEKLRSLLKDYFDIETVTMIGGFTMQGRPASPRGLVFRVWSGDAADGERVDPAALPRHYMPIITALGNLGFSVQAQADPSIPKGLVNIAVGGAPYKK